MTVDNNGILANQPASDTSAGDAKLIGRPSASDPNSLTYDPPSALSPGEGVCDSQPATLNQ